VSFKTASAILRGRWLIDKSWAQQHLPLVLRMAKGEQIDFGMSKDESTAPIVLSHKAASVYGVNYYTDLSRLPSGSIAMIDVTGPVTKYGDVCSYGSVDHVATLSRLSAAPNVDAIIINIDSPGGEAAGTQMLADAVKAAGTKKPVVALIDDGMAASAAMWVASAANEIYTTKKTDWVGSIGVYTTVADWYGYFESEGLKVRDIYAPQSTDKNFDYREALKDPPNDEPIKQDLAVLAEQFISTIKTNRSGKLTSDDWQGGKMYFSKEAAKIGLTDGQKTFDQVIRRVNTLIQQKQNSNSNTMAFEKTLSAAKAESFEVVDGGFLVEEAHLNSIEAALDAAAKSAALLETQTELAAAAKAELAKANEKVAALETENATLLAENERLAKQDAAKPSTTGVDTDPKNANEKTGWAKFETSYDAEMQRLKALQNS
jgi:protease-4